MSSEPRSIAPNEAEKQDAECAGCSESNLTRSRQALRLSRLQPELTARDDASSWGDDVPGASVAAVEGRSRHRERALPASTCSTRWSTSGALRPRWPVSARAAAIIAESETGIRIPAFESPPTRTPPTRCAARSSRVSSDLLFGCPRSLDFPDRVGGPLFWRVYKRALSRIITEHTIEGVLSALALGLDCAG